MKRIITFILFALLILPLEGQIGRYPFYAATAADTLGPEMISNGTFEDDTDWTVEAAWTISGGVAAYDDVTDDSKLYQVNADMLVPISINTDYKITFTLNVSSGNCSINITNASRSVNYVAKGGKPSGDYTLYFSVGGWSGGGGIAITGYTAGASFTIDNISLKKVL